MSFSPGFLILLSIACFMVGGATIYKFTMIEHNCMGLIGSILLAGGGALVGYIAYKNL